MRVQFADGFSTGRIAFNVSRGRVDNMRPHDAYLLLRIGQFIDSGADQTLRPLKIFFGVLLTVVRIVF